MYQQVGNVKQFKLNFRKSQPPIYIEKFNIESFKEESTKKLYQNRLKDKIALKAKRDNPSYVWKQIKIVLKEQSALENQT